mmetsp:Transcript_3140/g.7159  ORF Transcript_3140/g.7159 Transcript_3140/m.7159 type:complete len:191 (-) Transcript_3140:1443-2015(-)
MSPTAPANRRYTAPAHRLYIEIDLNSHPNGLCRRGCICRKMFRHVVKKAAKSSKASFMNRIKAWKMNDPAFPKPPCPKDIVESVKEVVWKKKQEAQKKYEDWLEDQKTTIVGEEENDGESDEEDGGDVLDFNPKQTLCAPLQQLVETTATEACVEFNDQHKMKQLNEGWLAAFAQGVQKRELKESVYKAS